MAAPPAVGHTARVLGFCDQHGVAGSRVTRSAAARWMRVQAMDVASAQRAQAIGGCRPAIGMAAARDLLLLLAGGCRPAIGMAATRDLLLLLAGEIFQST